MSKKIEERLAALEREVSDLFPGYELMPEYMSFDDDGYSIVIDRVLDSEDFPEIFKLLEKARASRLSEEDK